MAQATYPEVVTRRAGTIPSLFGLAPCGVCLARCITATAVRSYRTFSPLPRRSRQASSLGTSVDARAYTKPHRNGGAVYFLWHFPSSGLNAALPDVIRHTALRSSDFPPPALESAESDRPAQLPTPHIIFDAQDQRSDLPSKSLAGEA